MCPDPAKLLRAEVTITDILDAVRRTNLIDSPGLLQANHQLYLELVTGQVRNPAQIGDIVVKTTPAGVPVRVGDVASVAAGVKPVYTVVTADGKPAVLLSVNRQPDSNTVRVADEVHDEVEAIRKSLPPGVQMQPFYDQSIIVTESIKSVRDAILIGLILASAIMVLFLHDWGSSLVAGLVIPATIAGHLHRSQGDRSKFQSHDAGRIGGSRGTGHRRCHCGRREHRPAPRRRARAAWKPSTAR